MEKDTLELECPACESKMEITFGDIGGQVACKACGAVLDQTDIGLGSSLEDAGGRMKEMFGSMFEE